jgi:hypothetical protein
LYDSLTGRLQFLKGHCYEIFAIGFFLNRLWVISNFFKNLWRYLQVKVHHQFQRHQQQICHQCVNYTSAKFATGINNTGGKFATNTARVVDAGSKFGTSVIDTSGK